MEFCFFSDFHTQCTLNFPVNYYKLFLKRVIKIKPRRQSINFVLSAALDKKQGGELEGASVLAD